MPNARFARLLGLSVNGDFKAPLNDRSGTAARRGSAPMGDRMGVANGKVALKKYSRCSPLNEH